jgi:DNA repair protein RadC
VRPDAPARSPLRKGNGLTRRLHGRLRLLGAGALSDAELLALLLAGQGMGGSLERAQGVLSTTGSEGLRRVADAPAELEARVGPAAAARVLAAFELGRRVLAEPLHRGRRLRGPADIHGLFGPRLRHLPQEEFHVVLLDARHRLLRTMLVTRGTADTSLVHAREVFRDAVREGACAVILVHNHPSGDPRPSPEDRTVTRQLAEAGSVVGIPVLDHVIVGDGRYVSMAEEGGLG